MKKTELIKLVENTIRKILKEGKSYKAWVIPIGTINIGTGKTMYDWSIYDHPNSEVALAQGSLLFGASGLKIGDVFDLVDNDSQRSLRNSVKIQDIAKCKKEDVLAMLKKNGYDYYPARPFQKKSNTKKLNVSYSLKGYEELNNSAAYQKIIDHYTYKIVNLINVNKELSEKALYGELNKVVGDKTGDDSIEAVHRFLGYINSDEGKKDLLKSALSKISVVLDRRDWKYEDNPEQLKTDRIELKNKIIKELPNIYTSGNIFDKDRKISECMDADEEELDEISTSAGAGAYMTPNAFSSKTDDKIANMNGYKKVKVEDKELEEMIEQAIRKILVKEDISDKKFKKGDKVKTRDGNIETVIKVNSNGNIETEENNYSWPPSALEKINENILMKEDTNKKFSALSKQTPHKVDFIVAYPDNNGIETEENLNDWENKDPANRELYFAKDKKEAQDILKHLGYYTNMD